MICGRTDRLAAGHGRMAALVNMKQHGDPMPDGLVIDDDGEWCVPVTRGWSCRDDAELEAYIIADNYLTEQGGWNNGMLAEMLHDIHAADPTLFEATGVTADTMDDLMRAFRDDDADGGGVALGDDDADAGAKPRPEPVTCPHCGEQFTPKGT